MDHLVEPMMIICTVFPLLDDAKESQIRDVEWSRVEFIYFEFISNQTIVHRVQLIFTYLLKCMQE